MKFDLSWDEFVEYGDVSFGSWWDHVPEWWAQRDEPNVLFLKYEDMQKIAQATTIDSMIANTTQWKDQHFLSSQRGSGRLEKSPHTCSKQSSRCCLLQTSGGNWT